MDDKHGTPEGPLYEHDCEICTFLGSTQNADLYFCPQGGIPTVLARYSSAGPDYISGMVFVKNNRLLAEALRRAADAGLIEPEPSEQQECVPV